MVGVELSWSKSYQAKKNCCGVGGNYRTLKLVDDPYIYYYSKTIPSHFFSSDLNQN